MCKYYLLIPWWLFYDYDYEGHPGQYHNHRCWPCECTDSHHHHTSHTAAMWSFIKTWLATMLPYGPVLTWPAILLPCGPSSKPDQPKCCHVVHRLKKTSYDAAMWSILNPEQPHCYLAVYPLNMTSHRLPCCPSSNLTRHTAAMCFLSKSDQSHCCYLVLCLNVSLPCGLLSKHEQPNRHHVFFVVKIRPATPLLLGLLSKRDQPHCRRAVLCLSHVAAIWSIV